MGTKNVVARMVENAYAVKIVHALVESAHLQVLLMEHVIANKVVHANADPTASAKTKLR